MDWQLCADVWRLIYAYLSNKDRANLIRASPYFKDVFLEMVLKEYESSKELKEYQDWILSCGATLGFSRFSLEKTVECKNCNITMSEFFMHDGSFAYEEDEKVYDYHVCKYCIELDDIWEKCKSCNKKSFADELRDGNCWCCINGVPPLEDELPQQVSRKIIGKRINQLEFHRLKMKKNN